MQQLGSVVLTKLFIGLVYPAHATMSMFSIVLLQQWLHAMTYRYCITNGFSRHTRDTQQGMLWPFGKAHHKHLNVSASIASPWRLLQLPERFIPCMCLPLTWYMAAAGQAHRAYATEGRASLIAAIVSRPPDLKAAIPGEDQQLEISQTRVALNLPWRAEGLLYLDVNLCLTVLHKNG